MTDVSSGAVLPGQIDEAPTARDQHLAATSALFQIDERDQAPTYIQLERRVRVAVADGALKPGDALPSVRSLARQLGVSPNTVGRAYSDWRGRV